MWGEDHLPKLVGLKVNALWVSVDDEVLVLQTDSGQVAITTYADCCSETWFADIVGVSSLIGHTITAATAVELPDPPVDDGRSRQESDAAYGIRLTTDAPGDVDIVYRNSSNGYYGGSLDDVAMTPEPGWVEGLGLRPILADWQAGTPVRD